MVSDRGAKTVYIRVGSNHTDRDGEVYTSTKFWVHPRWNNKTIDNDVGIISPSRSIQYNANVKALTLASSGRNIPAGTEVLVTGWGLTSENGQGSDRIMAIRVPTVTNEDCLKTYTYISDMMLCAGVPEGGKSICQGDSGGPAVAKFGQVGIASFSIGCARPRYPGGYARVTYPGIRNWIKTITGV
ncbi:trypsin-7-like [Bicyclus anynana]|uniref:Trypsin-7-like n=1 Tax=Bicyclus anynana TaxID=110368 RepID=A0ABM3LGF3_BICAN|nr:trypsin-7-like [Bicyclus anynana]